MLDYRIERGVRRTGGMLIAGVDEAGRGPLAGPVVAAAVVFPPECWIYGVDDSKKLAPAKREALCSVIRRTAVSVGVGIVDHCTIDRINILQATMLAMRTAVDDLECTPDHLLVDGNRSPDVPMSTTALVRGDARCFSIAAASIVAKVVRDSIMMRFHEEFPQYGFAQHKGYGTPAHIAALRKYGPSPIHRRSFTVHNQPEITR